MAANLLYNSYEKSMLENEKNIRFWESYLEELVTLDFSMFSQTLTVPVLVPIGSKIMFRGELKHTNEVTVALGANYFTKCSINQAEILKLQRIEDAKCKLELLKKERDYLQNQQSFRKRTVSDDAGYDIIEVVTEDEDKVWRKQHRENMRQYKQRRDKTDEISPKEMSDKELWDRLEELELQEELENELANGENKRKNASKVANDNAKAAKDNESDNDNNAKQRHIERSQNHDNKIKGVVAENEIYLANSGKRMKIFQQPSKLHLFELVVERHNTLKEMVSELRAQQRECKSEDEFLARLDEREKLEELEDEIAVLEDMLASDDDDDIEEASEEEGADNQQKKSVAFADQDDSETFELTFKHSKVEPCRVSYDSQKGIIKPSDLYNAFPDYFTGETSSILKKPKCDDSPTESESTTIIKQLKEDEQDKVNDNSNFNNLIVVGDIVEKVDKDDNSVKPNERPMSLFKKRRQQQTE